MKIQLVNAPLLQKNRYGEFFTNIWPPLGIMYLASYLQKKYQGHLEIKLTDGVLLGNDETLREIEDFTPDILGVSAFTSNSTGGYYLVNRVKEKLPQTFIIFGGVHASALPEEVYKITKTDLVSIGEGEQTLLEIVEAQKRKKNNFSDIPGLVIKKNGRIVRTKPRQFIPSLDTLPFPAYKLLPNIDKYVGWFFQKQRPETIIMSTRGCPFHCFFCTDVVWKSSKPYLRLRSPENVADELEWLKKNYGIKEYFDMADEFNCVESWAIKVCQEIKKRKLNMSWKCQLRADKVSEDLARNLAEAGCWYVHLGVESGNQKTLNGIGKKITLNQVENACKTLKKHNIKVDLLLMIFNIWEEKGKLTFEGVKESLKTLKFGRYLMTNNLADFFGWSPTTPYPGAPLYSFALKHQLIPNEIIGHWEKWNNIWGISLNLPGISRFDYTKVKVMGSLLQSYYLFTKMRRGVNIGTFLDFVKRALGIIISLLRLTKDWLQEKVHWKLRLQS